MKPHPVTICVKTPTFGDFVYQNQVYLPRVGEQICLDGSPLIWKVVNVRHNIGHDEVLVYVTNASIYSNPIPPSPQNNP
jgi:hypothetical protein